MDNLGASEFQESNSLTFEWTLRDLKNVFDNSIGEGKSKVAKSAKFGGGRWQLLFYANSGTDGGFVSLYLSSEPTAEEKRSVLDGKWVRDGIFQFTISLQTIGKTVTFNSKEAHNHSFSHKTANWGWAQFARREAVYYASPLVRKADAFLITCTITSSPVPVNRIPTPSASQITIPSFLIDTIGSLLNDPTHSDVEFLLPRRGRGLRGARSIFASKKILSRFPYFETMFRSGFAESSSSLSMLDEPGKYDDVHSDENSYESTLGDSDEDDESVATDDDIDLDFVHDTPFSNSGSSTLGGDDFESIRSALLRTDDVKDETTSSEAGVNKDKALTPETSSPKKPVSEPPASPRPDNVRRSRVIVRDAAYSTYYAMLYYIYTDFIVFAPLSSSFDDVKTPTPSASTVSLVAPPNFSESQETSELSKNVPQTDAAKHEPSSRREWIRRWSQNNPKKPSPCSAKAAYRLADKLELWELKERAAQHINKSLTVQNISYEVFSPFSAAFGAIRKVQVDFFLDHWSEIRASDTMRNVWQQIRNGRHPGFEEVWPFIARHLEFKPQSVSDHDSRK